jgi:hydroxyacylglutathione hydrolase
MAAFDVVPVRAFSDNYIWTIRDHTHAVVVDPGDAAPVIEYLDREGLTLAAILNTHHHADHVGGNGALLRRWAVPVFGPSDPRIHDVTQRLSDGDRIVLPHFGVGLQVYDIPGHTRTHIAFYGGGMLFCGDTLFAAGCGRLFEGTPAQMHTSPQRPGRASRRHAGLLRPRVHAVEHSVRQSSGAGQHRARGTRKPCFSAACAEPADPAERSSPGEDDHPVRARRRTSSDRLGSRYAGKPLADPVSVFAAIREGKNNF